MLLSTAIPTVIAAIVIVIISSGNFSIPIKPSTSNADIKLGIMPIIIKSIDLNKSINMKAMIIMTNPSDLI
tara:strand:+ start:258 stop:470 length:213 start_codon:yes stop_codon:yes gene_type:complete